MATVKQSVEELEARLAQTEGLLARMESLLRSAGMPLPSQVSDDPTDRPDYIEHGSDEHLAFLGLERVEEGVDELMFETYRGQTGLYALVDPFGPYVGYADPKQAASMALRSKVMAFEAGKPPVHARAPEMWYPKDEMPELARQLMQGR